MSKFTLDKLKGNLNITVIDVTLATKQELVKLLKTLGGNKSKPSTPVPSFRFHKSGSHAEISEIKDTDTFGHVLSLGEKSLMSRLCLFRDYVVARV